jgi:outer membrane protein
MSCNIAFRPELERTRGTGLRCVGLKTSRGLPGDDGEVRVNKLARCLMTVAVLLIGASLPGPARAQPAAPSVRIAVVSDGPAGRELFPPEVIEREALNVLGTDLRLTLPQNKRFAGDRTREGVNAALDRALADREVDIVLALGILGSHEAAQRAVLAKPVIAAAVIDPILQHFPLAQGTSGRRNFAYVADFQSVGNEVTMFHRIVGFRHLAALVDEALMNAMPELATKAEELSRSMNVRITIVRTNTSAAAALAGIPADADAVYVTGLLGFRDEDVSELARGLSARRLPSFSILGRKEVESGLLMTTGGAERDMERLARRMVLMIQRIVEGENPSTFEVSFPTEQRLIVNMRTAGEIGFSPRWEFLTDAEQLFGETTENLPPLTLLEAMRTALQKNPSLEASRARLGSTADDVRIARSNLLPSLDVSASRTQIDADRASPLIQPEKETSAGLQLQQVLYSENAWAGYSISRHLLRAAEQGERQDALDTLESAASSYLNLLRAKSVEAVRRSNVENTRKNLETSRVRETVGLAERSDYLRWVAQLARDKQALLAAESTRRQAEADLTRILHRPSGQPFATVESGLDDPLSLVSSPRTQAFLDSPAKWAVFMEYAVSTALENSPEIAQTEALVAGRQRAVTAAKRSYFLPDLALVSNGSKALQKSGVGSESIAGGPNDEAWSVSLQATLPIFTGRRRSAELSQARYNLREIEAERAAATDGVEARTRVALHRTAGSYPSIDLSKQAADAAGENLRMVTDAYARGIVSVTDLIDAQDAALSAGLAAADAKYTFLIDFVAVLRSMSEFEILLDPGSREAWYGRVDEWFRTHVPNPQRSQP